MPKTSALSKGNNAIESAHDFLDNCDGMAWIEYYEDESPVVWDEIPSDDKWDDDPYVQHLYMGCVSCGVPASMHRHKDTCRFAIARWAVRQALEEK